MGDLAECDDRCQFWQAGKGLLQIGPAGAQLFGRRLIFGRYAFDRVEDHHTVEAGPIIAKAAE